MNDLVQFEVVQGCGTEEVKVVVDGLHVECEQLMGIDWQDENDVCHLHATKGPTTEITVTKWIETDGDALMLDAKFECEEDDKFRGKLYLHLDKQQALTLVAALVKLTEQWNEKIPEPEES
jgi:hypothetical protein